MHCPGLIFWVNEPYIYISFIYVKVILCHRLFKIAREGYSVLVLLNINDAVEANDVSCQLSPSDQGVSLWKHKALCCHLHYSSREETMHYRQTAHISRTITGNKIFGHSYVVGASPVGAAPNTSSFSAWHLASMVGHKHLQDKVRISKMLWVAAPYIKDFTVLYVGKMIYRRWWHGSPTLWTNAE